MTIAQVTPLLELSDTKRVEIFNLMTGEIILSRDFDFKIPNHPEVSGFNYVQAEISFHNTQDGPKYQFSFSQAGYVISENNYYFDYNMMLGSGVGKSEHEDLQRENETRIENVDNHWLITTDHQSYELEKELANPISAFIKDDKIYILDCLGDTTEIRNYILRVINTKNQDVKSVSLFISFEYTDQIENISINGLVGDILQIIINTNNFNYDMFIDLISEENEIFLRSSDFNRFVK